MDEGWEPLDCRNSYMYPRTGHTREPDPTHNELRKTQLPSGPQSLRA